jgi:myo-inositol-1(or 4)-monophosphatase
VGSGRATTDLGLIAEAARAAGREALARQRTLTPADVQRKADQTPVTSADLHIDRMLREALTGERPGYGWLSEESDDDPARLDAECAFVVDPIDGTEAYIDGRTDYVISIAVVKGGRPVAAVLYQPAEDALYTASPGAGAALNGDPIGVRDRDTLAGGRLVCPERHLKPARWRTPWPDDLTVVYRNSMAYRIAMVARGDWHGALALSGKSDWDLAAADLILSEAGGVITDLDGDMLRYNGIRTRKRGVVCGAPGFHGALMRRLQDWRQDERHG